ncbi:response regulator transcription factor [Luteolibacter sp. SL250]|uniref:response regulator transcription factor n=1 Tax=Luteolibacter sp. SL250 TaxID=2995170 RepID=UPI002270E32B|nr:response regulator transcription factor [Luteolibacter sp. SL250]WAC18972.1 response regulator transcription factor [Luteolibacter sp. SL250]
MRVLIVEDEPDLLHGLAKVLREEGYSVDLAEDGEEGLYKAVETNYDAVILDIMLPLIDGLEVLRRLREKKETPVLMLTARSETPDRVAGLDRGADDYLGKPFDLDELLARLRALIRRAAGRASPFIVIGAVGIDPVARKVTRSGAEIVLTAREYAVLEFLGRHRGRVISRTELYEHVFDETDDTLSNLIDVHVSNLRKKLGHELITTRRGHGYCIE